MSPILARSARRGFSADIWARKFSTELLLFTHRQWTYRNTTTHFKPSEGKTVAEHESIHQQLLSLLELSPSELPLRHRHLLSPEHTDQLLLGSTTNKQFWIAEVQSALAEAALVRKLKKRKYRRERVILKLRTGTKQVNSIISTLHPPVVPREKGLKWKKRRKK